MAANILRESPSEKSFMFLFSMGQFLGVFPLEYVNGVTFSWRSFKTIYSLLHITLESFVVVLCFCYGVENGWSYRHMVRAVFYASNLWGTIGLLKLTIELPPVIRKWYEFDSTMENHYGYPRNLYRRTKLTSLVATVYAVSQIIVYLVYNTLLAENLARKRNITYSSTLYFKTSFPQVFEFVPYSFVAGLLCQLNYVFTYLRMVYIELFTALLSSFLALRFKQITERLTAALDRKRSLDFWREVREDYDKICNLCKVVDDTISSVIFVSFSGNLILLLAYLRNCTLVEELNLQKIYNVSAFVILLIRGIFMLLYAAWVNDESKKPAFVLNSVSSTQYNTEIQRFLLQISFDSVAFTGSKMFKVTRSLILDIGGVILTYELVLVQFADLNVFG